MSEIILAFQTQLSGVMETVFKAAIFEITRLVEDSFLEEVSRSREQVEALKKKLQWCESKGRRRCVECGNNKLPSEERQEKSSPPRTGVEKARILKEERHAEERWRSCGVEKAGESSALEESDPVSSPANTAEHAGQEEGKLDSLLKSESVQTGSGTELQNEWKLSTEGTEDSDNSHNKTYSEQELQQIQNDWSSGLDQAPEPEPEPDMDHIQGLLYRSRYNMEDLGSYSSQELDMGGMNGLADPPQRAGEILGYGVLPGSLQTEVGTSEECRRQLKNKRGNKGSPSLHNTSETGGMDCLLINEEGYLQDVSSVSEAPGSHVVDSQAHPIYNRDAVNDGTDCFYSGDAFSQSLELSNGPAGMLGDREDRDHACSQCMITFPDQVSLKAHLNGHRHRNVTNSYICNQCGKKFPQACNLKVHQRVHQREGLHLCSHCGKGFTSFSDLRRHRCSQAGDKPYSCSLCGNKFSRLWNLKLHRRIHTQEKPHRCSMCDKSFTRADILKVHQRTHTGERPYSCRVCGLTFKRLDHLRSHQRKHGAILNN